MTNRCSHLVAGLVLLFTASFCAVAATHHCATDSLVQRPIPFKQLNPVPHISPSVSQGVKDLLLSFTQNRQIKSKAYPIYLGLASDKGNATYLAALPASPEAYYLHIGPTEARVLGRSQTALFYGVQDLVQRLTEDPLYSTESYQSPDVALRGIVEGFYGTPWSHQARLRMMSFMGRNRLNVYIYGPKDDPYHSSPHWRDPYPAEEERKLEELIHKAQDNHVRFCWAIHPGKDIQWTEKDRLALVEKLEAIYRLGARSFAVFFDDISGDGTDPVKQADLLNYLQQSFVEKKKDVDPMIICPTEYNKAWSANDGAYLKVLGQRLLPDIKVMWTGDRVVSDIDQASMQWINQRIQRKALIWWNFPVTDYVRNRLLLGPVYGNTKDIAPLLSGFVSNPMEHAEASKIALSALASYLWDMEGFSEEAAWEKALQALMPISYPYLLEMAKHNSDLGPNGHRYRREESVAFLPLASRWEASLAQGNAYQQAQLALVDSVYAVYAKAADAANRLLLSTDNPLFLSEAEPWIRSFAKVAQFGKTVVEMQRAMMGGQEEAFQTAYYHALVLVKEIERINATENQNPYQPGIEAGSTLYQKASGCFEKIVTDYNKKYHAQLLASLLRLPLRLQTSVPALKTLQVRHQLQRVYMPVLQEYFSMKAGDYIGIKLDRSYTLEQFHLSLEGDEAARETLRVWVSEQPYKVGAQQNSEAYKLTELQDESFQKTGRYVYLLNTSDKELTIKLQSFSFLLQAP